MDLLAIQAALTSLKVRDRYFQEYGLDINSTIEIQGKVIELQAEVAGSQTSAISEPLSLSCKRKLGSEEKINSANEWGDQVAIRSKPWRGPAQVYALKKSKGEEPHFLCSNCSNKRKVILNPMKRDGWMLMACPSCKAKSTPVIEELGRHNVEKY